MTGRMAIGWDAVTDVDWGRLFHAYGAANDTPDQLRALTGEDAAARSEAVDHLWGAVLHQGTPWAVTAPTALVVAGVLADPAADAPIADGQPLRAMLLRFLGRVAEAGRPEIGDDELHAAAFPPGVDEEAVRVAWDAMLDGDCDCAYDEDCTCDDSAGDQDVPELDPELIADATDAIMARVVLEIRSAAEALLPPVEAAFTDGDARVRVNAVDAASSLLALPGLRGRRGAVAAKVEQAARRAVHRDERAALVLSLGYLGEEPRGYLADPDPAVRACAALAPTLAQDEAAVEELLSALRRPAEADEWFTDRPPQIRARVRFALLDAALRRVADFERLLPAAVAIAKVTSPMCADWDWGRLLAAAFPSPGDPPAPPARLTDAQRAYLRALVDNEQLWDAGNGNARLAFEQVGLPHDRDACRRLAESPS
ncbi:hypothetical protein Acsp04_20970 [Actinomadura sp. NBRC 104425]|uniref:hypothetical protein n=1 Tax=Actinomadura sp. NBRC 104425 TaxID=3032204 RepID=UPI0024A60657|nr:hypothetical protein [Actinomadura sp. NBRC 104425]GLZ11862.1 hypothetical protein Acsp04_20970 [Actinomadura sp. NBRC 104425]